MYAKCYDQDGNISFVLPRPTSRLLRDIALFGCCEGLQIKFGTLLLGAWGFRSFLVHGKPLSQLAQIAWTRTANHGRRKIWFAECRQSCPWVVPKPPCSRGDMVSNQCQSCCTDLNYWVQNSNLAICTSQRIFCRKVGTLSDFVATVKQWQRQRSCFPVWNVIPYHTVWRSNSWGNIARRQ